MKTIDHIHYFWEPEMVEKFKSHTWVEKTNYLKCSLCSVEEFEWMIKYSDLTCAEVCIKQIIE